MSFKLSKSELNNLTSEFIHLNKTSITPLQAISKMKRDHPLISKVIDFKDLIPKFREINDLKSELKLMEILMEELKSEEQDDPIFWEENLEFRYKLDDAYTLIKGNSMRILNSEKYPKFTSFKTKDISNLERYNNYRYTGANKYSENHYILIEPINRPILLSQNMSKKEAFNKKLEEYFEIINIKHYKRSPSNKLRNSYRIKYRDKNDLFIDPKTFLDNIHFFTIFETRREKPKKLELNNLFFRKLIRMNRNITKSNINLTRVLTNIISTANKENIFGLNFYLAGFMQNRLRFDPNYNKKKLSSHIGFLSQKINLNMLRIVKGYKSKFSREKVLRKKFSQQKFINYHISTINNLIFKLNKGFEVEFSDDKEVQAYREKLMSSEDNKLSSVDIAVKKFLIKENIEDLNKTIVNFHIFRFNEDGKVLRSIRSWNNLFELNEYTILRIKNIAQIEAYCRSKIYGSYKSNKEIKEFYEKLKLGKFDNLGTKIVERKKRTDHTIESSMYPNKTFKSRWVTSIFDGKKYRITKKTALFGDIKYNVPTSSYTYLTLMKVPQLRENEYKYYIKALLNHKLTKKTNKLMDLNQKDPIACFWELDKLFKKSNKRYQLLRFIF